MQVRGVLHGELQLISMRCWSSVGGLFWCITGSVLVHHKWFGSSSSARGPTNHTHPIQQVRHLEASAKAATHPRQRKQLVLQAKALALQMKQVG